MSKPEDDSPRVYCDDAEELFGLARKTTSDGQVQVPFDYLGATAMTPNTHVEVVRPLTLEEQQSPVKVAVSGEELKVTVPPPRQMMGMAVRITPGYGSCLGCGIFGALDNFSGPFG